MKQPRSFDIDADIIDIGGGVTGTSAAFVVTKYTDVKKIVLLEKEETLGAVNSKSTHNSQTLHEGNIESNYNEPRASKTSHKANILKGYFKNELGSESDVYAIHHKMLIGVGAKEAKIVEERFHTLRHLFPNDILLTTGYVKVGVDENGKDIMEYIDEISQYEPNVIKGRNKNEIVKAHFSPDGYTVDFGKLSASFVEKAQQARKDVLEVLTGACVKNIEYEDKFYYVTLQDGRVIRSKALMVGAGGHTPLLLKEFHKQHPEIDFIYGDGSNPLSVDDFSILSVAGSFFNTHEKMLNGKVYTVQDSDLPFAAVHGDPEVHNSNITRLGPTAIGIPKLERYKKGGMSEYFKVFEVSNKAVAALWSVLSKNDWKTFKYLGKNMMYELPFIGKRLFAKEARKIIPTLKSSDIDKARGYGGTRPQILNTTKTDKKGLDFGEAKFTTVDKSAIFNITPSPGATTCLGNAYNDVQAILKSFDGKYTFHKEEFEKDFMK